MASITARPSSVRTMVSVQSDSSPIPPVEMSACSAAKSGQRWHPSRVQAWHSLRLISWYWPDLVQIWKTPLMFILAMSSLGRLYFTSNSSSNSESSKLLEHSRPMLSLIGLDTLPTLRCHITGPMEVWQLMPTRARRSRPRWRASSKAMVLAE